MSPKGFLILSIVSRVRKRDKLFTYSPATFWVMLLASNVMSVLFPSRVMGELLTYPASASLPRPGGMLNPVYCSYQRVNPAS
jgi:hypothetical protein